MTVLVSLGFEALSLKVLEEGIREAKIRKSDIIVMHVLPKNSKPEEVANGDKLLNDAVSTANKKGIKAVKRLVMSNRSVGECIVEFAEKTKSELIVMGCGVVRTQTDTFLTTVTEYVVLNSKQNLLLVKSGASSV